MTYLAMSNKIMATPVLGKIDEFDRHKEEWLQYGEHLGFFFSASGREQMCSIFVGSRWSSNLQGFAQPDLARAAE